MKLDFYEKLKLWNGEHLSKRLATRGKKWKTNKIAKQKKEKENCVINISVFFRMKKKKEKLTRSTENQQKHWMTRKENIYLDFSASAAIFFSLFFLPSSSPFSDTSGNSIVNHLLTRQALVEFVENAWQYLDAKLRGDESWVLFMLGVANELKFVTNFQILFFQQKKLSWTLKTPSKRLLFLSVPILRSHSMFGSRELFMSHKHIFPFSELKLFSPFFCAHSMLIIMLIRYCLPEKDADNFSGTHRASSHRFFVEVFPWNECLLHFLSSRENKKLKRRSV